MLKRSLKSVVRSTGRHVSGSRARIRPDVAKFRPKNDDLRANDGKEINIKAESQEKVLRDLKKLGFQTINIKDSAENAFLDYLEESKSPFKKSAKNLNKLKSELNNSDENAKDRIAAVFDFLLKEMEGEVRRFSSMTPEQVERISFKTSGRDGIDSENDLEKALTSDIMAAYTSQEKYSLLTYTENVFRILADLNSRNAAATDVVSIEQLVQVFELSKLLPISDYRLRGIFLSGHLLYSLKTLRMDPVNESFYIDALVYYGIYKEALSLFQTNCPRVHQRWWFEMGMMVHLRANHLQQFDRLFELTERQFGSDYISPKVLRLGIRRKLYVRDYSGAEKLTQLFIKIVRLCGITNEDQDAMQASRSRDFENEEDANAFLNEKNPPSFNDFIAIIQYHLHRKRIDSGLKLLAQLIEMPGFQNEAQVSLVMKLKLFLLRDFEIFKQEIKPHMSKSDCDVHLAKLKEHFDALVNDKNAAAVKNNFNHLLFDSVVSLSSNPTLVNTVEEFITRTWFSPLTEPDKSKKLRGILDVLLRQGKEEKALKILEHMEQATSRSNGSSSQQANAHHYAVFFNYYADLTKDRKGKALEELFGKVKSLLDRMHAFDIFYNAVFLTSLLRFYRTVYDFNNCSAIVNPLIDSKLAKFELPHVDKGLKSFFERRNINLALYKEIWRCLHAYHIVFGDRFGIEGNSSNAAGWRYRINDIRNATQVHPSFTVRFLFKCMVEEDNILPDMGFYHLIIKTIIASRDWAFLPAILKYMSQVHGVSSNAKLMRYIDLGLKREYIALERDRLEQNLVVRGNDPKYSLANRARRHIEAKIKEGTILQETAAGDVSINDRIIKNILQYLNSLEAGKSDVKESETYLGL
ncbi:LAMI_0G01970g1_1 [Lachancea mirantina]|uniref:LAMI_0G01970g1_1 n=1 Tax=Lachancea mirantina TaxID=1230905 RepID=A0A1G4K7L4_9SACH|nr:LAMI_0G01970g1_1 [Lachancea mirantina]